MKCKNCGASVQARQYGKHISKCRKTQRDMFFFADSPQRSEPRLAQRPESKCYPIGGVNVKFPYKPYPVQFQYMSKVIQALKNRHHALLESPTGTGKSLSLLCSTLSWQQKVKAEYEAQENRRCPVHDVDSSFHRRPSGENWSGASAVADVSNSHEKTSPTNQDDSDFREGRKFGRIASVKIHNPVIKKSMEKRKTRTVHVFIQDVYRNVKVKRIDVRAIQELSSLRLVEIDENARRSIFVEIPKSGVAMVQRELYLKPNTKLETWVLNKPADYEPAPTFIDETSHTTDPPCKSPSPNNDPEDEDFVSPNKSPNKSSAGVVPNEYDTYDFEKSDPVKSGKLEEGECSNGAGVSADLSDCCCDEIRQRRHFPKIYFCTRTHRQIAQIIRELNKTEFNQVSMSILSSREHSCVNPKLTKEPNKNDKCRDLRQEKMCIYGENLNRLASTAALRRYGIVQAWDVEELAEVGKRENACPYYASVEMAKSADIVFAPYNYILDPFIAAQRELGLSDNVVIFDEGHNIEDVCRSSVGYEATQFQLGNAISNLEDVIEKDRKCLLYNKESGICFDSREEQLLGIKLFLKTLLDWTLGFKGRLVDDYFEHSHYSLDGISCLKQLQAIGITSDRVEQLYGWVTVLADKDKEVAENRENTPPELDYKPPKPKTSTLFLCEKFVITYRTFAASGNAPSFSLCIKQSPLSVEDPHTHKYERMIGITLAINCLNPSVVFKHLSTKCHSVIVTSGTLSPMDTFQSELGAEFRVQHEGRHVVPRSNFLALNLTAGPGGHSFNAGYKNAETFKFQDDIGEVVCKTCSLVPHGVLVFFPSYRLLEKVSERWQATGLWEKIENHKVIVSEPRGSNRHVFNEAMGEFDSNVESGALLLAVCRGKISEGVDFADNNARAVITIGLPFPNFKSTEITDKRKYNDKFCKELGLLSGQDWYTIQAFRAVNQALGRCLRHIADWGAIIMIESRLPGNERYWRSISRWIRDEMISTDNCSEAFERLEYFCHEKRGMLDQYDMNSGGFINQNEKKGMLDQYDINSEGFINQNETKSKLALSYINFYSQKASVADSPVSHSKYPVADSTGSTVPTKTVPLFSGGSTLTTLQGKQPVSIIELDSSPSSETREESNEEAEDGKTNISCSPDLFVEGREGSEEEISPLEDGSTEEKSPLEDGSTEEKSPLEDGSTEEKSPLEDGSTEEISPARGTASSEEKRVHSPDENTNLVIKRRRVSRVQQHLNESSSECHVTSSSSPSRPSLSPSPSTTCPNCSNKLLKTRPSPERTVLISDFIRGRYDIRALGKLQFTAFPDENCSNSTLGNMGVFCSKCGAALGRVTFSIGDDSMSGIVQLQ